LLEQLKNRFYHKHLEHELVDAVHVKKESISFEAAKKIGILFDATDIANYSVVRKFEAEYKKKNKSVELFGFINSKNPNAALYFKFFSRKDINWFYKPKSGLVDDFMNRKFDILINAYIEESKPLLYISTLSKASLRVGLYFPEYTDASDMMVTIKNESNLDNFFLEINQYLNIFT